MKATRWIALIAAAVLLASGIALTQFGNYFGEAVPTVDVDAVATTLDERQGGSPGAGEPDDRPMLLVDVRSEKETAVSMIPGAITREEFERDAGRYAQTYRIVPYCTVGARSKAYTRELRDRGIDAVNFEGSIMGWIEEGLPLVTPGGEPTPRVHTWSAAFSVPEGYDQVTD